MSFTGQPLSASNTVCDPTHLCTHRTGQQARVREQEIDDQLEREMLATLISTLLFTSLRRQWVVSGLENEDARRCNGQAETVFVEHSTSGIKAFKNQLRHRFSAFWLRSSVSELALTLGQTFTEVAKVQFERHDGLTSLHSGATDGGTLKATYVACFTRGFIRAAQ